MNDLDFDELDRAVNSLVSKKKSSTKPDQTTDNAGVVPVEAPKPELNKPEPRAFGAAETPDATPKSAPTPEVSSEQAKQQSTETTPVKKINNMPSHKSGRLGIPGQSQAPSPRGGFIDIMAPKPKKSIKPSRVGATLKPTNSDMPSESPAKKPPFTKPIVSDEPAVSSKGGDNATPIKPVSKPNALFAEKTESEKWPDPLDFHDELAADTPAKKEKAEPTSPFIPDAKVEKRPLGGRPAPKITEPESDLQPEQVAPKAPKTTVPAELQPEVLAVEAAEPTEEQAEKPMEQPAKAVAEPPKTPVRSDTTPEESIAQPAEVDEEVETPVRPQSSEIEQQVRDSAMMSIPQQYRTADKHVDDSARPVFDTKEYHPPLLEATTHHKKGSMWLKLFLALLIVALLALGAYFVLTYLVQPA